MRKAHHCRHCGQATAIRMKLSGDKKWSLGRCTRVLDNRQYEVQVAVRTYTRNRSKLQATAESPPLPSRHLDEVPQTGQRNQRNQRPAQLASNTISNQRNQQPKQSTQTISNQYNQPEKLTTNTFSTQHNQQTEQSQLTTDKFNEHNQQQK